MLRTRPVRPDLGLEIRRKQIFQMKLQLTGSKSSALWTMSDLEAALGDLKIISQETTMDLLTKSLNIEH